MKHRTKPRYLKIRKRASGARVYYWRRGEQFVRLSDDPAEAWREAEVLNEQADRESLGIVPGRPIGAMPGTIAHLIHEYRTSPDFRDLAVKTCRGYEPHLAWLHDGFGDLKPAEIDARWVQRLKTKMADTPHQGNARITVVRLLYGWGRRHGLAPAVNPAAGFRRLKTTLRDQVWAPDEIARFVVSARPSQRLAVLLGLFTLQREGDLIRMPWSAYDGRRIELRQRKTGRLISARAHAELKAALDTTPRQAVTVLVSEATGQPYGEHHFRHSFARERDSIGIRAELQFRDLRRTGAVLLSRRGATPQQIAALGGWGISQTTKILETYVPVDAAMADEAVAKMGDWQ